MYGSCSMAFTVSVFVQLWSDSVSHRVNELTLLFQTPRASHAQFEGIAIGKEMTDWSSGVVSRILFYCRYTRTKPSYTEL